MDHPTVTRMEPRELNDIELQAMHEVAEKYDNPLIKLLLGHIAYLEDQLAAAEAHSEIYRHRLMQAKGVKEDGRPKGNRRKPDGVA